MTDRRIAVFACNRSGSTVLFELLRRIRDREGDTSTSETPFQRAIERWRTIFEPAPSFTATGACRLGTTDYVAASAGRFVFACGVPIARHPNDGVHVSYSRPTDERVAMVEGRARFVSVRNPLDILVSNAFEIEHVLPVMRGVDRIPPDAREVYGRTRLDDDCWVDGTARYIARFYETWLERRRDLVDHRYEQLLEQPVATIQGLASVLGRSIDSSTAQSLWEQVGHRPLKANPAHFFRPGAEKWRQYLDDRHASTLREIGWPALFDELGYSFPSRFSRVRAAGSRPSGRSRRELAIGDEMNHCMFGTPLRFRDTSIIAVEEGSTRVVANDRTWLESAALFSRGGTECSSLVRTDEVEVKSRG